MFEIFCNHRYYGRERSREVAKRIARTQSIRHNSDIWTVEDENKAVIAKYQNGTIIS